MTLSIVIASSGRRSLSRTIDSVQQQLAHGDEILISINNDCPYGDRARNQLQAAARGDHVLFMDDDDVYTPDALARVRGALELAPDRMHLFRMRYVDGRELWQLPSVRFANVGTPMVVVPRATAARCQWTERDGGDYDFIVACEQLLGKPVFHEQVIALIRPALAL